jgi:hypothetical protein
VVLESACLKQLPGALAVFNDKKPWVSKLLLKLLLLRRRGHLQVVDAEKSEDTHVLRNAHFIDLLFVYQQVVAPFAM